MSMSAIVFMNGSLITLASFAFRSASRAP